MYELTVTIVRYFPYLVNEPCLSKVNAIPYASLWTIDALFLSSTSTTKVSSTSRSPFSSVLSLVEVAGRLVLWIRDKDSPSLTAIAMHVARLLRVFSATLLCTPVFASVVVQHSLEDQLPLIARTNTPYSWTASNNTFVSTRNATLEYTATDLPGWLTFDRNSLSFHGTPSKGDEGSHTITLTAKESNPSDQDSSSFSLIVSSAPAPKVKHPVVEQFKLPNPSLSSVYLVSQNSALKSEVPALRISTLR